MLIKIVEEKEL